MSKPTGQARRPQDGPLPKDLKNLPVSIEDCDFPNYVAATLAVIEACAFSAAENGMLAPKHFACLKKAVEHVDEQDRAALLAGDNMQDAAFIHAVEELLARKMEQEGRQAPEAFSIPHHLCFAYEDIVTCADQLCIVASLRNMASALDLLDNKLAALSERFSGVLGVARQHLQDVLPRSLGAYFQQTRNQTEQLKRSLEDDAAWWKNSLLGQTSQIPALHVPARFVQPALHYLNRKTGMISLQAQDGHGTTLPQHLLDIHSRLQTIALVAGRLSRDLILLSSGPKCGFNEIALPAVQPGSSIMPGKVNPVMPDMMVHLGMKISANHYGITLSLFGSELETPRITPAVRKLLFATLGMLPKAVTLFAEKTLGGIQSQGSLAHEAMKNSPSAIRYVSSFLFGEKTSQKIFDRHAGDIELAGREVAALFQRSAGEAMTAETLSQKCALLQARSRSCHEN